MPIVPTTHAARGYVTTRTVPPSKATCASAKKAAAAQAAMAAERSTLRRSPVNGATIPASTIASQVNHAGPALSGLSCRAVQVAFAWISGPGIGVDVVLEVA